MSNISFEKIKRMQASGSLLEKLENSRLENARDDLHESVQNNLEVAREQIERSRQITSDSRELIGRVQLVLAQSERLRLDMILQYPQNPMIPIKDPQKE